MKRTKILIPTLSVMASIGFVAPFATSCARDNVILIDQFFKNPDGDADTIISKTLSLKEHKVYSFKVEFKNAIEGQFPSSAVLIGPQRTHLAGYGGIIAVFDMKFNGEALTRVYDEDQFAEGTYGL
ncbi:MAG: hypothetical protein MJ219_03230 [Mycoplasmoidaceae bacterium]|nr:hypothetical protein [Mycoplasmoidaceae bacterium]